MSLRNTFVSSVKIFTGGWILAMTTITTYWTFRANNESTDTTERSKAQTDPDIYDFEEIVKKRAKDLCQKDIQGSQGFSIFKRKEPNLKLDWSGVKFHPPKPNDVRFKESNIYENVKSNMNENVKDNNNDNVKDNINENVKDNNNKNVKNNFNENVKDNINGNGKDITRLFFETVLKNESKIYQRHNVRAERQTSLVCESSLNAGFTIGTEAGFSIPIPITKIDAAFGFASKISLKYAKGNVEETRLLSVAEDIITLPPGSTITVSMKMTERNSEHTFKTWMGFTGVVKGTFYNQKTKRKFKVPIKTVFEEDIPENMKQRIGDIDYIKIEGSCKFKNDIQHEIIIK